MGQDAGSPSRSRTYNKPVNSRKVAGRKSMQDKTSSDGAPELSALLAHHLQADPDLARLVDSWPALPTHIRAAILALVQAASK